MEISAASSSSCFTRMNCPCKKKTCDNILLTVSAICVLASCFIPIRPLAGALSGAAFFVFGHKAFSTENRPRFAPRTWTQLAVGFGLNTGISTAGFCVPLVPNGIPLILLGSLFGLGITYYDKLWKPCPRLTAVPPPPHYAPLPHISPPSTMPPVSAAAG